MKIIINSNNLKRIIPIASKAIPNKPPHPILLNILIKAEKEITLTSFDLTFGIICVIEGEVVEPGEITVPSKILNDIVGKLPNDKECTLATINNEQNENNQIFITDNNVRYVINCLEPLDYINIPKVNDFIYEAKNINPELFIKLLNHTVDSVSSEDNKQTLNGIYFTIDSTNEKIEAVSTNGQRLAIISVIYDSSEKSETFNFNIPGKIAKEILLSLIHI